MDTVNIANKAYTITKTNMYSGVNQKSICNWKKNMHQMREKMLVNPNSYTVSTDPLPEYPVLENNLKKNGGGNAHHGWYLKT
jgi:hypothetical protein